jgi:hypothetical protein
MKFQFLNILLSLSFCCSFALIWSFLGCDIAHIEYLCERVACSLTGQALSILLKGIGCPAGLASIIGFAGGGILLENFMVPSTGVEGTAAPGAAVGSSSSQSREPDLELRLGPQRESGTSQSREPDLLPPPRGSEPLPPHPPVVLEGEPIFQTDEEKKKGSPKLISFAFDKDHSSLS